MFTDWYDRAYRELNAGYEREKFRRMARMQMYEESGSFMGVDMFAGGVTQAQTGKVEEKSSRSQLQNVIAYFYKRPVTVK